MICKNILPFCGFFFHFLDSIVCRTEVLNFDVVQNTKFFLFLFVILVLLQRNQWSISQRFTLMLFSKSYIVLAFTFRSIIHSELSQNYLSNFGLFLEVKSILYSYDYNFVCVLLDLDC